MNKEIWRDIAGFEDLYLVSNMGRVKSLERTVVGKNGRKFSVKERILMPHINEYGYLQVNLCNGSGKNLYFRISPLLILANVQTEILINK